MSNYQGFVRREFVMKNKTGAETSDKDTVCFNIARVYDKNKLYYIENTRFYPVIRTYFISPKLQLEPLKDEIFSK